MVASSRTRAFISYSHTDRRHLERLQKHLAYYARKGIIDFWDDTKIKPGSRWREDIRETIASAGVAILLVSADFLASEFITHDELPPLLAAAKEEGATILPVILSSCGFNHSELAQFQAVNNPSKPLIGMSKARQEELWAYVAECVKEALSETLATLSKRAEIQPFVDIPPVEFNPLLDFPFGEEGPSSEPVFPEEESQEPVSQKTVEEWLDENYGDLVEEEKYRQFDVTEELYPVPEKTIEEWLGEAEDHQYTDPVSSLFACEQAIRLDSGNERAFYIKGVALEMLGRIDEALLAYESALNLEPTDISVYNNKFSLLLKSRRLKKALDCCMQALKLLSDAESIGMWNVHMADILLDLREYKKALACYRYALQVLPTSQYYFSDGTSRGTIFKQMAITLLFLGKSEEGIAAYRTAAKGPS